MANNHIKYVEVNKLLDTVRIVEKDRLGHVFCKSKATHFNCGIDTMKLALTMHGYLFHHETRNLCVFKEV